MAFWDGWYSSAVETVGASWDAAQSSVGALFKEPPLGSIAYDPDDVSVSDAVRSRQTSSPADLFPFDPGPLPVATDIQAQILTRPKSWDEMTLWEKAKAYATGIVPGAVADTVGLGRPGAQTPADVAAAAGQSVTRTAESVGQTAGGLVASTVGAALGVGPGGLGGFLSSTLVKVVIGLLVIVVGLFFVMRIQARAFAP